MKNLWNCFNSIPDRFDMPCLVIGDLNSTLLQSIKENWIWLLCQLWKSIPTFSKFGNNLGLDWPRILRQSFHLTEWSQGCMFFKARLDRAMCNYTWRSNFPTTTIRVLPRSFLYHNALVLQTLVNEKLPWPFKLQWKLVGSWIEYSQIAKSYWGIFGAEALIGHQEEPTLLPIT